VTNYTLYSLILADLFNFEFHLDMLQLLRAAYSYTNIHKTIHKTVHAIIKVHTCAKVRMESC